jgi:hypothetical protein
LLPRTSYGNRWSPLPDGHPLADRERVTPDDLRGEPFVLFPKEKGP